MPDYIILHGNTVIDSNTDFFGRNALFTANVSVSANVVVGTGVNKTIITPTSITTGSLTLTASQVQGALGAGSNTFNGNAVAGASNNAVGVLGTSVLFIGVEGISATGEGVHGESTSGAGVVGRSNSSYGVFGTSNNNYGVYGVTTNTHAVYGISNSQLGVIGVSNTNTGTYGESTTGIGAQGLSKGNNYGVLGVSWGNAPGVQGVANTGNGLQGVTASPTSAGVLGVSSNNSIYGQLGIGVYAFVGSGQFSLSGNAAFGGTITVGATSISGTSVATTGTGTFGNTTINGSFVAGATALNSTLSVAGVTTHNGNTVFNALATHNAAINMIGGWSMGNGVATGIYGDGASMVMRAFGNGPIYLQSASGTVNYALFNNGVNNFYGTNIFNGRATATGSMMSHNGNNTGTVYLGNSGSQYISFDGGNTVINGGRLFNAGQMVPVMSDIQEYVNQIRQADGGIYRRCFGIDLWDYAQGNPDTYMSFVGGTANFDGLPYASFRRAKVVGPRWNYVGFDDNGNGLARYYVDFYCYYIQQYRPNYGWVNIY